MGHQPKATCVCGHSSRAHRSPAYRCDGCDCQEFKLPRPPKPKPLRLAHCTCGMVTCRCYTTVESHYLGSPIAQCTICPPPYSLAKACRDVMRDIGHNLQLEGLVSWLSSQLFRLIGAALFVTWIAAVIHWLLT